MVQCVNKKAQSPEREQVRTRATAGGKTKKHKSETMGYWENSSFALDVTLCELRLVCHVVLEQQSVVSWADV